MGNTYFQFKQFTINQARATLKVCTESCIFGSYIPTQNAQRILDIGTGTGVLALMLAQRADTAVIDAVELDLPSFEDAQQNFNNSPWATRLNVELNNINTFATNSSSKYDLIVCNPPFFIQQLKSPDARTNSALHGNDLKPIDLFTIVNKLTIANAHFYVLLPESEMTPLIKQFTSAEWSLINYVEIYQNEKSTLFRTIAGFCKKSNLRTPSTKKIFIRANDNSYTNAFTELLKPYYLHL
jgi:tRNA1Val (adenine37-N6)-methyltransferase